jgi:hypothetical protein
MVRLLPGMRYNVDYLSARLFRNTSKNFNQSEKLFSQNFLKFGKPTVIPLSVINLMVSHNRIITLMVLSRPKMKLSGKIWVFAIHTAFVVISGDLS